MWQLQLPLFLLVLIAHFFIERVQQGKLSLVTLHWDGAATEYEVLDSQQAAQDFHLPALIVVSGLVPVLGLLCARIRDFNWTTNQSKNRWRPRFLLWALLLATLADLATTLWFMHERSIDLEIHPGIRLVTASLGRTVGPIVAKSLQLSGLLLISAAFPKFWPAISSVGMTLAALAAAHNAISMLS